MLWEGLSLEDMTPIVFLSSSESFSYLFLKEYIFNKSLLHLSRFVVYKVLSYALFFVRVARAGIINCDIIYYIHIFNIYIVYIFIFIYILYFYFSYIYILYL